MLQKNIYATTFIPTYQRTQVLGSRNLLAQAYNVKFEISSVLSLSSHRLKTCGFYAPSYKFDLENFLSSKWYEETAENVLAEKNVKLNADLQEYNEINEISPLNSERPLLSLERKAEENS